MELPSLSWTTDTIDVCTPNECLYPVLDSIIAKVNACPAASKMREDYRFMIYIVDTIYNDAHAVDSICMAFVINNIPGKYFNHKWYTKSLFYYNGVTFYSTGRSHVALLRPTGTTAVITCIDPEKIPTVLKMDGSPYMIWSYSYINGTIICNSYGECGEARNEGTYYLIIEDKDNDW
jgi:hypothetical protein